jgi:hypothetical protein
MDADQVEQMLYEHAIRTKIRAPLSERVSNLGYNRIVNGGVVAGAALVCTLAMTSSSTATSEKVNFGGASLRPQVSDPANRPVYHNAAPLDQNFNAQATAGLALSRAQ